MCRRAALALALLAACATPAAAQSDGGPDAATRRTARAIAKEGIELLKAGEYAQAQQRLHRAYQLYPAPTVALFEGEALEKLGKLVEAAERYEAAKLAELPADAHSALRDAVARAEQELARITPLIPQLVVQLEGVQASAPGLALQLDGASLPLAMLGLPRPVNPGQHRVQVLFDGQVTAEQDIALEVGQTQEVRLEVQPPATPQPHSVAPSAAARLEPNQPAAPAPEADQPGPGSAQRTWGWVSLSVGGAGLVTGAVAGLLMLGKDAELEENCPDARCPAEYQDEMDAFVAYRTLSTVGYAVGIVGIGVGAALLLTASTTQVPEETAVIRLSVGPLRASLVGRF